jgi:xylanolytic transcriptional activator XlnR
MLSNPLHRFSSYHSLPVANMMPTSHISSNHMHGSGLESLTHGSQYALQQLQRQIDVHHNSQPGRSNNPKHRQHPYSGVSGGGNGRPSTANGANTSGPVRRRISRACDQCNQLRTKCDGQNPCAHCVGMELNSRLFTVPYAKFFRVQS